VHFENAGSNILIINVGLLRSDIMKLLFVRCLITLFMFIATDIYSNESVSVVESPYDLQDDLILVQLVVPPAETNALEYDSGVFLYMPDVVNDFETALFSEGLIFEVDEFGNLVAPVSIFEDFESRDTVYLNSDNEIIFRIPPLYDYNPFWVLQALYPDTTPPDGLLYQYDPSRVIMKAVLLPFKEDLDSEEFGKSFIFAGDQIGTNNIGGIFLPAGADGSTEHKDSSSISNGGEHIAMTNRATVVIRKKIKKNRNIYVDDINGSDQWSGKTKTRNNDNGPKHSIKEGLKAVKSKGRIYIAEGCYADKIDIRGKNVRVKINGNVILAEEPVNKPDNAVRTGRQHYIAQTNQVVTALISEVISKE
jgi:hypothetical protein